MTQIEQIRDFVETIKKSYEGTIIPPSKQEFILALVSLLKFIDSLPAESCLSECNFKEYLRGVFEANNGIENDPDLLVKLHAPTLLELAQKELPDSPDFEAEWKRYTHTRKDDMRTNAVTMNVKEVALYFAKWGRKQVLTAKPSEELEEEIHRYFKELEKSDCVSNTRRLAKHFAEWGAEHLKSNH